MRDFSCEGSMKKLQLCQVGVMQLSTAVGGTEYCIYISIR